MFSYEVGYAHALGKQTILMTQDVKDIPFDLTHYPHIIYGKSVTKLKNELKKYVKYFINHPDENRVDSPDNLLVFVEGVQIEKLSVVNITLPEAGRTVGGRHGINNWKISYAIQKIGRTPIEVSNMQFCLIYPSVLANPSHPIIVM